jgi:hypothetical protein
VKIFLISPVARITDVERAEIEKYVAGLESKGCRVHLPIRDTNQVDETGGHRICEDNLRAIVDANEVHIWYNETSGGSKFDMGMVFVLMRMEEIVPNHVAFPPKRIVIANRDLAFALDEKNAKSFLKVFSRIADGS